MACSGYNQERYVDLSKLSGVEVLKAINDFSRKNTNLKALLAYCYANGITTVASEVAYQESDWDQVAYVAFKIDVTTIAYLNELIAYVRRAQEALPFSPKPTVSFVTLPSTGEIVCNFLMPDDYDGVLFIEVLKILQKTKDGETNLKLAFDIDMQYMYDIVVNNQQYIDRSEYKLGNYLFYANRHNMESIPFISGISQDNDLTPYFGAYYFTAGSNESNIKRLSVLSESIKLKKEKLLH